MLFLQRENPFYRKFMISQKSPYKSIFVGLGYALVIILAICIFLVASFFTTHHYYLLVGSSMEPTLPTENNGAYVDFSETGTYGDIIIIYNNEHIRIVKRVIGLGGDKVGFYREAGTNQYYIARIQKGSDEVEILYDDYIENISGNFGSYQNLMLYNQHLKTFETINHNGQDIKFLVVPEDSVFVLGDNRGFSQDSSTYGAIQSKLIVGKIDLSLYHDSMHIFTILAYCLGLVGTFNF